MRGLVISTGGTLGAEAAGYIKGLVQRGVKWDYFGGASTGALIAGMTPSPQTIATIERLYTTTTNDDVWKVNPFPDGAVAKLWAWLRAKLTLKVSLGDFSGLREIIDAEYIHRSWALGHDEFPIIDVCAVGERGSVQYFNLREWDRDTAVDAMYASASPPVFSQGAKIWGIRFYDGGLREHVPIQRAIDQGCTEIDVIILKRQTPPSYKVDSVKDAAAFALSNMMYEISNGDVSMGKLMAKNSDVQLNIYWSESETDNAFDFNPEEMTSMFWTGYENSGAIQSRARTHTRIDIRKGQRVYPAIS